MNNLQRQMLERRLGSGRSKEIGRFKNDHGEEYILFRKIVDSDESGVTWIAGDETDWKALECAVTGAHVLVFERFTLSKNEEEMIADIVNNEEGGVS